jgi:hypothetical protein
MAMNHPVNPLYFLFLFCLGLAIPIPSAVAQAKRSEQKLPVFVSFSGDDAVGQDLAYSVREELRKSAAFNSVTAKEAIFFINLVSLDLSVGNERNGSWSAVAVSYVMENLLPLEEGNPQTWYKIHMTTNLFTVGRNRTESVAKSIVSTLDREIEEYKAASKRD